MSDIKRPIGGWNVQRKPTTPGEMLLEEFMKPFNLSQNALASKLRVPTTRIADIVHDRRAISVDTALRLARFFKMSPDFWLNLQHATDLWETRQLHGSTIEREVSIYEVATASK